MIKRNPLAVIGRAAAIGAFVMLAGAIVPYYWEWWRVALFTLAGAAAGGLLGVLNVLLTRE